MLLLMITCRGYTKSVAWVSQGALTPSHCWTWFRHAQILKIFYKSQSNTATKFKINSTSNTIQHVQIQPSAPCWGIPTRGSLRERQQVQPPTPQALPPIRVPAPVEAKVCYQWRSPIHHSWRSWSDVSTGVDQFFRHVYQWSRTIVRSTTMVTIEYVYQCHELIMSQNG